MSVINRMLQELDRRNAPAGSEGEQPPQQVRVVAPPHGGHEWFWRIVAALMLVAVAWVGWVAYQLQLRPSLVTEEGLRAAQRARSGPVAAASPKTRAPQPAAALPPETAPAPAPAPAVVAAAPAPAPEPAAAPASPREQPETFKLAKAIETPVVERPQPPKPEAPKPQAANPEPQRPEAPKGEKPAPAKTASKPPAPKPVVSKREHAPSASERADAQFRRAVAFLNHGRVSEAENQLIGALHTDPSHVAARQAYVALLLEQKRADAAKRVLRQALEKDPTQPVFSLALARILAEQRDYAGALEVMDAAGGVAKNADFLALRGAVLQRLNRHQEAVDAYLASIQAGVQPATTWVGLGISLEALGRKQEAAQAYRRSLSGALAPEVREYADSRMRALE